MKNVTLTIHATRCPGRSVMLRINSGNPFFLDIDEHQRFMASLLIGGRLPDCNLSVDYYERHFDQHQPAVDRGQS